MEGCVSFAQWLRHCHVRLARGFLVTVQLLEPQQSSGVSLISIRTAAADVCPSTMVRFVPIVE